MGWQPGKRAGDGNESQFAGLDALRIPFEVTRRIFDNYVNSILPRYPCFTSNELWHHFGQVYSNQQPDSHPATNVSRFVVSMVLARIKYMKLTAGIGLPS